MNFLKLSLNVLYQAGFENNNSQGDVMANLTPFIPVLMLITRVIHQSTLHFAVAGCIVYQSIT